MLHIEEIWMDELTIHTCQKTSTRIVTMMYDEYVEKGTLNK